VGRAEVVGDAKGHVVRPAALEVGIVAKTELVVAEHRKAGPKWTPSN
jgi:hypothetical protein